MSNLCALAIDGRNYFNACQRNVHWTETFPVLSALSISHFTPVAHRSESFTTYELKLSLIPFRHDLTYFRINDVHLDESSSPVPDDDDELYFDGNKMIVLKNMHNTHCVMQVLNFLRGPSDMHITHCPNTIAMAVIIYHSRTST
jgi:hypothetical protein